MYRFMRVEVIHNLTQGRVELSPTNWAKYWHIVSLPVLLVIFEAGVVVHCVLGITGHLHDLATSFGGIHLLRAN